VQSLIGNKIKAPQKTDQYLENNETIQFAVARVMLCGLLKNQYYRSKEASAKEALILFVEQAKQDPVFLLKAIAFARKANMKGMPILGLACLATNAGEVFLDSNRDYIVSVLSTFAPNQLLQFVELVKSKKLGKGFGSRPQGWVSEAMETWDSEKVETYTLQYKTTIKTLLRLVHPHYNDIRGNLSRYVLDPSKKTPNYGQPVGKRQKALEKIKKDYSDAQEVAKAMIEYRLPWDAVKGFYAGYNTGIVGLAALTQMNLSALLLNLKSLDEILQTSDGQTALSYKMEEVKQGRSIPLDFAKPYIHSNNNAVKQILVKAIADTLSNKMNSLEGRKVGLSIDVSGSMAGEALITAGLLAVPFLQLDDLWFTTFSDDVHEQGESNKKHYYYSNTVACPKLVGEMKDKVNALLQLKTVGGTNLSAPIVKARRENRSLDLMVLITDEHQNNGQNVFQAWEKYKKNVNPRAQLWIINASNTDLHLANTSTDPSITVYQTMTPAIFDNLKFFGQDLVSAIKNFEKPTKKQ
jgi:60 kDa SS-A/Ro ribonucleoprotein